MCLHVIQRARFPNLHGVAAPLYASTTGARTPGAPYQPLMNGTNPSMHRMNTDGTPAYPPNSTPGWPGNPHAPMPYGAAPGQAPLQNGYPPPQGWPTPYGAPPGQPYGAYPPGPPPEQRGACYCVVM